MISGHEGLAWGIGALVVVFGVPFLLKEARDVWREHLEAMRRQAELDREARKAEAGRFAELNDKLDRILTELHR
jgi:hypothetical protein